MIRIGKCSCTRPIVSRESSESKIFMVIFFIWYWYAYGPAAVVGVSFTGALGFKAGFESQFLRPWWKGGIYDGNVSPTLPDPVWALSWEHGCHFLGQWWENEVSCVIYCNGETCHRLRWMPVTSLLAKHSKPLPALIAFPQPLPDINGHSVAHSMLCQACPFGPSKFPPTIGPVCVNGCGQRYSRLACYQIWKAGDIFHWEYDVITIKKWVGFGVVLAP